MIEIPGYKILEKIHGGRRLNSFRASHNSNQKMVLIKVANHEANNYLVETWYEITRNLKPEIIVKPMEIESLKGLKFVVLEDFGAKPFSAIAAGPLSVQELLGIFSKATKALFHIHESNIIHNDINPDNIWFNPKTGQLKISGFGLSTKENTPTDRRGKKDIDQYTIEYISPEQTGRTSLDVTRATDFYSLGCSLYQIISGTPPFLSQDTLELIHCHLARTPIMPHQINTNIPESLSGIIMKLLEKNPVARYQSCTGLQKDFEICLAIIQGKNRVDHFLPGRHDLSSDLCFSEKLYGRKKELKSLTRAFAGENETGYPLILIRGAAGVGKSALVEQAFKQSNLKAYFVTGKHDKISSRNAVPSALESVILQILGEGKTKVKEWRDKIINALGNNAQSVTSGKPGGLIVNRSKRS
ncbi:MAG: serine/threonine-protein kinase PknK [Desulfobacula sp.]|nr:serine/threonine-protein kinase PknK [Desulfobacula sp.]